MGQASGAAGVNVEKRGQLGLGSWAPRGLTVGSSSRGPLGGPWAQPLPPACPVGPLLLSWRQLVLSVPLGQGLSPTLHKLPHF